MSSSMREIQDSDDEGSFSPPRNASPRAHSPNPDHSTQEAQTGSTEQLTREIFRAHQSLVAPSPSDNSLLASKPHSSSSFNASISSPTMGKIQRRQTTMDTARKKQETYGRKRSSDDIALHIPVMQGSWEGHDDDIDLVTTSTDNVIPTGQTDPTISPQDEGKDRSYEESELPSVKKQPQPNAFSQESILPNTLPPTVSVQIQKRPNANFQEDIDALDVASDRAKPIRNVQPRPISRDEPDELAVSPPLDSKDLEGSSRNKRKRGNENRFDESMEEGIVAEQYNPRPSRFRTSGAADNVFTSIDYSKRPEAMAKSGAKSKSKLKRRKTDGGAIIVHIDDGEEEQVEDNVPPPASAVNPVKVPTEKKDARSAVNQQLGELPSKDPSAKLEDPIPSSTVSAPPKRKKGRPRKETTLEKVPPGKESGKLSSQPATAIHNKEPSSKRKRSSSAKEPVSKEFIDTDDELDAPWHALDDGDSDESPIQGRRKRVKAQPDARDEKMKPLENNFSAANVPVSRKGKDAGSDTVSSSVKTPIASTPSSKPADMESKTPQKEEKAKGPDKHSPLNKGKVTYRVGLSKRARIEPLLRMVRK